MRRFVSAILLSLVFVGLVPAQSNRLTVNDVFNLEVANDPQISPDGRRIIYVRQFTDIMTDRRVSSAAAKRGDDRGRACELVTSGARARP